MDKFTHDALHHNKHYADGQSNGTHDSSHTSNVNGGESEVKGHSVRNTNDQRSSTAWMRKGHSVRNTNDQRSSTAWMRKGHSVKTSDSNLQRVNNCDIEHWKQAAYSDLPQSGMSTAQVNIPNNSQVDDRKKFRKESSSLSVPVFSWLATPVLNNSNIKHS